MHWFRLRGGIHPEQRKETGRRAVRTIPLASRLYVPVQQHVGAPAEPLVAVGQPVLKGERIAGAQGAVSAPIHAPTSGRVVAIEPHTAPHPSGLPIQTIIIEPDGEEHWTPLPPADDPDRLTPEAIAERVREAGIVGMGGAAFPAAVKLNLGQQKPIHTLIINGGECEPYLTCDDRLMQEHTEAVVRGARMMRRALGARRVLLAVEENKPRARSLLRRAARRDPAMEVRAVPTRYPMGSEKQMIHYLTGHEVPAGRLSADLGVVVHNVATVRAVDEALRHHRPLVSRIVTVAGDAIRQPDNLEVPVGTPARHLVEQCGGLREEPARLVLGGPMMGITIPHLDVPITKGTNGVLALGFGEVAGTSPGPCIRCGQCVSACPIGLRPLELAARTRAQQLAEAVEHGLKDCIGCGACAYVCPSSIPLTQYFNYAKGELASQDDARRKTERTRALAAAREERLRRQREEKKAAAARRKAAQAAKKAAAEESDA